MKILLVGGSEVSRRAQRTVLSALGDTDVRECTRGADALSRARVEPPDLVVAAGGLPDMNGLDFLRAFRAVNGSVPVVYIGEGRSRDQVMAALRAGADNYIASGWTPDLLHQRLTETLETAARAARPAA